MSSSSFSASSNSDRPAVRSEVQRVFVYGTLLRGLANHHWLRGASFVREDCTRGAFTLVDLGDYPAVLDRASAIAAPVVGEVWDVDDAGLAQLDILEDYPDLYDRRSVELRSGDTALIYILRGHPEDHGMRGTPVPSGDYRTWLEEKRAK